MALNTFAPTTKAKSSEVNANFQQFSDHGRHAVLAWGFIGSVVATQTSKLYFVLPDDVTWTRIDVICDTAPTGQALLVNIQRSTDSGGTWTDILTDGNRPSVAAGSRTANTTTIDTASATANTHFFRAIIDQVGSTIAGADVSVILSGTYDLD